MNELIKLSDSQIGTDTIQTVNARDLHAFLEIGKVFAAWIQERIEQLGLEEGKDYALTVSKTGIRRNVIQKDYHLAIDIAKELAMAERNEKGKQARQYFIECERKVKDGVNSFADLLADPMKLRNALLNYTEKVTQLETKIVEQAPKVQFHDAVTEAINCQSVQEVAKVLGTGPNRLFKHLRDEGLLMQNNLPYQKSLDAGYFKVVERQYEDNRGESHTYTRTLVTGKGLAFIQRTIH